MTQRRRNGTRIRHRFFAGVAGRRAREGREGGRVAINASSVYGKGGRTEPDLCLTVTVAPTDDHSLNHSQRLPL
jgi:hypothetical protein